MLSYRTFWTLFGWGGLLQHIQEIKVDIKRTGAFHELRNLSGYEVSFILPTNLHPLLALSLTDKIHNNLQRQLGHTTRTI
jgi:hypothetical protein